MQDDKEFLGREPVKKLLFRLAVPTVAAQTVNMLYNVIDRIYIGHMPENGALALTGVGVCMPVILMVSAFTSIGNAACSILVAVVRKFVLLIPLIYLVPALGILPDKAHCVYLAEPIADVIAVAFTSVLFFFQFRKAMDKLEKEREALRGGEASPGQ